MWVGEVCQVKCGVKCVAGLNPAQREKKWVGCMEAGGLAEWLRRWTRNPLGSARAASNPAAVVMPIESLLHVTSLENIAAHASEHDRGCFVTRVCALPGPQSPLIALRRCLHNNS